MKRLRRFVENTDLWGRIQAALIVVGLGLVMSESVRRGFWIYTVPLIGLMFLGTYWLRNLMVEHLSAVRPIMNALALVAIVASVLFRGSPFADSLWLNLLLVAFVSGYLGSFFWLVSDERIEIVS